MAFYVDLFVLSFCLLSALWLWNYRRRTHPLPHPPGPPGLPLVGNLLDVPSPTGFPWKTYRDWSIKYGSDTIRLSALGMNIVVANTLEVANELLDRRSSIYSDRPRMVMLNELIDFGWGLAFLPYNDIWKEGRKMAHHEFHSVPVKQYRPMVERSTDRCLLNLYRQPDKLMDNLRHLAAMTIMSVTYDIDVRSLDDHYITVAESAAASIGATANAGSYLVDVLPILKYWPEWLPGGGFQKEAREWRAYVHALRDEPYQASRKRLDAGNLGDCAMRSLTDAFLKNAKDSGYTDMVLRGALGSMYVGGADTTVSALGTFFLAMVLNPSIQQKAREELDHVLGPHRLPSFADQPSLPYIEAILRETLRWNPVVPLDVPHMLTENDVFDGYFLPKGSLVVANTWAILHDEAHFPDPEAYKPERFLAEDGSLDPSVRDPTVAAFGFGRRICPGRFLALDSMWLTIARVLAVFEMNKALDADGNEITPDGEYHRGFLCHPKPFPLTMKPRSKEHEALLTELIQQGI